MDAAPLKMKFLATMTTDRKKVDCWTVEEFTAAVASTPHPHYLEYLPGCKFTKPYFDSDTYYAEEPDEAERAHVFTCFQANIALLLQDQPGFTPDQLVYGQRHGICPKRPAEPHKLSFRAYLPGFKVLFHRMGDWIKHLNLHEAPTAPLDPMPYSATSQLLACMGCSKGKVRESDVDDLRVLRPFGTEHPAHVYLVQHLVGSERELVLPADLPNTRVAKPNSRGVPQAPLVTAGTGAEESSRSEHTPLNKADFLQLLSMVDFKHYEDWVKCVLVTRGEEQRTSDSYVEEFLEIASKVAGFGERAEEREKFLNFPVPAKGLTVGTLFHLAQRDNPKELATLKQRLKVDQSPRGYAAVKAKFEQTVFKVMTPAIFGVQKGDEIDQKTTKDLIHNYEDILYDFFDPKDGQVKTRGFLTRWFVDPVKRCYDRIDFLPPPLTCPPNVFNLYTGLAAEKLPGTWDELEDVDIDMILQHESVLCNHEPAALEYMHNWKAQIVQAPGQLSRTMILLQSAQRAGKNILIDWFGREILGRKYYHSSSNIEAFFGRFAVGFVNKLLCNLDEITASASGKYLQQMKTAVTQDERDYEKKGVTPMTLRHCARLIATSNKQMPLPLEEGDGRNVLLRCSSEKVGNQLYFRELAKVMADPRVQRKYFLFLQRRNLDNFEPMLDRPNGKYYKSVKLGSLGLFKRWLVDVVKCGTLPDQIYSKPLLASIKQWAELEMPSAHPLTGHKLRVSLEDYLACKAFQPGGGRHGVKGVSYQFDIVQMKAALIREGLLDEEEQEH